MAPKKKKTQLKPVARGFATTSVPKKVLPPAEPADEPSRDAPIIETPSQECKPAAEASKGSSAVEGSTGLGEEGQASQALVDKYQEKTEKEIARYAPKFWHPGLALTLRLTTDWSRYVETR